MRSEHASAWRGLRRYSCKGTAVESNAPVIDRAVNVQSNITITATRSVYDLIRLAWSCAPCEGQGHLWEGRQCKTCLHCTLVRRAVSHNSRRLGRMLPLSSIPGTKVVFAFGLNGWPHDNKRARELLELGAVYTVKRIEVGDSTSNVYLDEIPGSFNSVLFALPRRRIVCS